MTLNINFINNVQGIYGERGKMWLDELPENVAFIAAKYGLSELKPVSNLSYNYVLSGFQGSLPIILKLGLDIAAIKREAAALRSFSGFGAVKVLAENEGLLLLERAVCGVSLKSYFPTREMESIRITAEVMKCLHQAPLLGAGIFPNIKDWLKSLDKEWDMPAHYLQKARKLRDILLATAPKSVLLHGDLHHDNILQNGSEWVVIDPKGVIGDPSFEVAAFIRNPIPELLDCENALSLIRTRINEFSKILGFDKQRIQGWCFVEAVLSYTWALEDGVDASYFKNLTEMLFEDDFSFTLLP